MGCETPAELAAEDGESFSWSSARWRRTPRNASKAAALFASGGRTCPVPGEIVVTPETARQVDPPTAEQCRIGSSVQVPARRREAASRSAMYRPSSSADTAGRLNGRSPRLSTRAPAWLSTATRPHAAGVWLHVPRRELVVRMLRQVYGYHHLATADRLTGWVGGPTGSTAEV